MDNAGPGRMTRIANAARALFWVVLLLLLASFVGLQLFTSRGIQSARHELLKGLEQDRKSRVIAMIHRQENVSVLGVPVSSTISIEDSEAVLRAIRFTPPDQPIDLILHTPGGLVLAAEQIAKALVEHKGKVTVFVPHYAMSGGTLIALAADEIIMDANAVLGPVDPQIGGMPAASIVNLLKFKNPAQISDEVLILADMAQKARVQVAVFVVQLLLKRMPEKKAVELAKVLSEGRWTHDFPITVQAARELGLPVSTKMPRKVYELMDLYPQGAGVRPSVLYVPIRRSGDGGKMAEKNMPAGNP
ncbi:MAG: ATP-dependent Clp protease proteolytic subunit [Deltaproteobacteria bacterium]|nr:ATP-dependent Clp protease proteolytic subunit [Deltaproteobacteria bacterium]